MIRKLEDPPRLTSLGGAFPDLQTLLDRAQKDVLSDAQIEQLVNSFEERIAAGHLEPSLGSLETTNPSKASETAGVRAWLKTPRGKLSTVLAVLGLGATATVGVIGTREGTVASAPPTPLLVPVPANHVAARFPNPTSTPTTESASRVSATTHGASTSPSAVATGAAQSRIDVRPGSADEFRLVRAARQATSSDPTRALALAQEHLRQFPKGMLSQERETIAIEALMRLGNRAGAQQRAARFLAAFPTSPYAKRIQTAIGNLPRSEAR
jgi:hypothetical protein